MPPRLTEIKAREAVYRAHGKVKALRADGAWAARLQEARRLEGLPAALAARGYPVGEDCYAAVVYLIGLLRFTKVAETVAQRAAEEGKGGHAVSSALLAAYGINGRAMRAAMLAGKMKAQGMRLTPSDDVNLLRASGAPGRGSTSTSPPAASCRQNQRLTRAGKLTLVRYARDLPAAAALADAYDLGCGADVIAALCEVCRGARDVAGFATVRALAAEKGVELTMKCYTSMLWTYAAVPGWSAGTQEEADALLDAAVSVWKEMRFEGWTPGPMQFTAMLAVYARAARAARMRDPAGRGPEWATIEKLYRQGLARTDELPDSPRFHALAAAAAADSGELAAAAAVVAAMVTDHALPVPESLRRVLDALAAPSDAPGAEQLRSVLAQYNNLHAERCSGVTPTARTQFSSELHLKHMPGRW
eukprot:TRINITY_DN3436_c1_g1_i1.p1 TRINITY_DN3436_c1_g1~~TRINITY_DN3436_c1_g1_i1.p1  ORF type:complete len:418 (+),score=134.09 TRINITY_DN3436_c1_g1_i1:73-1326(+)